MPTEMQGRRVVIKPGEDPFGVLVKPGDYCGPISGFNGILTTPDGVMKPRPAIYFLLPIARDKDVPEGARCLHHVCAPPHTFTEEPDGSLTIRNSIGAGKNGMYYWHGYLTKGRWHLEL